MDIYKEIIEYGKLTEKYSLISFLSGNISVRYKDYLYITKTGSMLGQLKEDDIVKTSLFHEDEAMKEASMETIVHKAVYRNTEASAIIHTHPVYAVTLSLVSDTFIPVDSEGKLLLGTVPVLRVKQSVASKEVAEKIPLLLTHHKAVIVKGHGVFSAAKSLKEAFYISAVVETSSKIYYKTKLWISKVF